MLFLAAKLCFLRDELHINPLLDCPIISEKRGDFLQNYGIWLLQNPG